jgi:hypothetical protein
MTSISENQKPILISDNQISLNEETNLYKILEELEIDDLNKLRILHEIFTHENKLGLFLIDPIKSYIKKNKLITSDKKSIWMKKNQNGYSEVNGNDLDLICCNMFGSLIKELRKKGLIQ